MELDSATKTVLLSVTNIRQLDNFINRATSIGLLVLVLAMIDGI